MTEEARFVRIGTYGEVIMGRKARAEEVATALRRVKNPEVVEVRALTPRETRNLVQQWTSTRRGEVTGPFRRSVEKRLQRPRYT